MLGANYKYAQLNPTFAASVSTYADLASLTLGGSNLLADDQTNRDAMLLSMKDFEAEQSETFQDYAQAKAEGNDKALNMIQYATVERVTTLEKSLMCSNFCL